MLLEEHRVLARWQVDGPDRAAGLLRGLQPDRRPVDRRGVDRRGLAVPRPVVGTHRDREEARAGARLGRPHPGGRGDRHRLHAGRERAEGGHARSIGRGDDGPDGRRAELRRRLRGPRRERADHRLRRRRRRQARPVRRLLGHGGDPPGGRGQLPQGLVVGAPGRRDAHARAPHEAEVHPDVRLGDVLVDLGVREPGQGLVAARHEDLGLGGALGLGEVEDALREGERLAGCHPSARGTRLRRPSPLTTSPRPGRRGSAPRSSRAPRGRPGPARPCRSSPCRA